MSGVRDETNGPIHAHGIDRRVFAAACTLALLSLAAGFASRYHGLVAEMTLPSVTHADPGSVLGAPALGSALAQAASLLDQGQATAALRLLDRIDGRDSEFPYALRLRQRAEDLLRRGQASH